ncbi:MAG TPA: hypothetical protein VM095_04910 [Pyrinomonadaceae bacterium]|nr:hypothetical protein [Pyrinomonadaceae bacterium]
MTPVVFEDGAAFAEVRQENGAAEGSSIILLGSARRMATLAYGRRERLRVGDGIVVRRVEQVGEGAVKDVCARLGNRIDDCAARTTELRIVVRGLHGNFLHGVRVCNLESLPGNRDVVILRPVNQEVV